MIVKELVERLLLADQQAPVHVAMAIPTEMADCRVTGVQDVKPGNHTVWILWPTKNAGSGMSIGDKLTMTHGGLKSP